MKQFFFIALFVAIAGAIVFFVYNKKQSVKSQPNPTTAIIGTWKIDSITSVATNSAALHDLWQFGLQEGLHRCNFRFDSSGYMVQLVQDSIVARYKYQLGDSLKLVLLATDSSGEEFHNRVVLYGKDRFSMQSPDSSVIFFLRK